MPMKTFTVSKTHNLSLPGKTVGEEVVADETEAADLVSKGYLAEKPAAPPHNLEGDITLTAAVENLLFDAVGKAARNLNERSKGAHRVHGLAVPQRAYAEAKDDRTLGDWLQALSFSVNSGEPAKSKWGLDRLVNKYHARANPNFQDDWKKGMENTGNFPHKGEFDGVSKASAMGETSGPVGGFAVPVEFYPEIIRLAGDMSLLFPRVRKYPMTGLEMHIPAIDYTLGGSGQSPYTGGMVAQWGAEGQGFKQTNAQLRQLEYKASLLAGYTVASRTLLADNKVGLEAVLNDLIAETIAYYVDYAIFNGTGVNQPKGILNSPATILVNRQSVANGSTLKDMATMKASLLPRDRKSAFWMVSNSVESELIQMTDSSGRVVWLPNFPGMDGGPATVEPKLAVLGLPLEVCQLAAAKGTKGDISLIIPGQYGFALRQEIEIGVSEHVNWLSNQLTWRFLFRGDGQSRLNSFITLQNGDTVSPFVVRN